VPDKVLRPVLATILVIVGVRMRVVADDDRIKLLKRAARATAEICILSPISARKKATSVVRKAPVRT
jgi:hypothetical protein